MHIFLALFYIRRYLFATELNIVNKFYVSQLNDFFWINLGYLENIFRTYLMILKLRLAARKC